MCGKNIFFRCQRFHSISNMTIKQSRQKIKIKVTNLLVEFRINAKEFRDQHFR